MKLGRPSEAERLLNAALDPARKEGALGSQAERFDSVSFPLQRKQTAQALAAMARSSEFAHTAGGNRILMGQSELVQ
ncbi:MAG: hypothetical protein LC753_00980 [Acidobacteria bacterium]|nr:hypothetical protein [Acidobacteriota bacterium]MCA1648888.1 hypothetical protein [Acidobacteriota bacterium]